MDEEADDTYVLLPPHDQIIFAIFQLFRVLFLLLETLFGAEIHLDSQDLFGPLEELGLRSVLVIRGQV